MRYTLIPLVALWLVIHANPINRQTGNLPESQAEDVLRSTGNDPSAAESYTSTEIYTNIPDDNIQISWGDEVDKAKRHVPLPPDIEESDPSTNKDSTKSKDGDNVHRKVNGANAPSNDDSTSGDPNSLLNVDLDLLNGDPSSRSSSNSNSNSTPSNQEYESEYANDDYWYNSYRNSNPNDPDDWIDYENEVSDNDYWYSWYKTGKGWKPWKKTSSLLKRLWPDDNGDDPSQENDDDYGGGLGIYLDIINDNDVSNALSGGGGGPDDYDDWYNDYDWSNYDWDDGDWYGGDDDDWWKGRNRHAASPSATASADGDKPQRTASPIENTRKNKAWNPHGKSHKLAHDSTVKNLGLPSPLPSQA